MYNNNNVQQMYNNSTQYTLFVGSLGRARPGNRHFFISTSLLSFFMSVSFSSFFIDFFLGRIFWIRRSRLAIKESCKTQIIGFTFRCFIKGTPVMKEFKLNCDIMILTENSAPFFNRAFLKLSNV